MAEYIIRVVRLSACKLRFEVTLNGSLLYAFCEEDSLDALHKILTFCYYRSVSLRDRKLDDFMSVQLPGHIEFISLFSRVEREKVMSFYV